MESKLKTYSSLNFLMMFLESFFIQIVAVSSKSCNSVSSYNLNCVLGFIVST